MKAPNIDKVQRIAYANAYRRGFWHKGYSTSRAVDHIASEVVEFEESIIFGKKDKMAEEAGDIILCVLSTLHDLGIKGSDAIMAAVNKELLKESGDCVASQD